MNLHEEKKDRQLTITNIQTLFAGLDFFLLSSSQSESESAPIYRETK